MSDNLRSIVLYARLHARVSGPANRTTARHVTTLAALISGIVGSQSTQLPHIATHVPDGTKPESRVKRFARWLENDPDYRGSIFCPLC